MRSVLLAACAALVVGACGQPAPPEPEAPPPPQTLLEQVLAQAPEMQLVGGVQHLHAYQQAHAESQPVCQNVRSSEHRGIIPENVASDSFYAAYVGSLVISVQCGELRSMTAYDPREHWLVVYAPGATEAEIVNCANAQGRDQCTRTVPVVEAPAAPAP